MHFITSYIELIRSNWPELLIGLMVPDIKTDATTNLLQSFTPEAAQLSQERFCWCNTFLVPGDAHMKAPSGYGRLAGMNPTSWHPQGFSIGPL